MTGHHQVNGARLELSRIPSMMFQEAEVPKKWSLVSDGSMVLSFCGKTNLLPCKKPAQIAEVTENDRGEVSYCVLCSLCARTRQFCGPRSRELLLLVSPQRSVAWLLRLKLG